MRVQGDRADNVVVRKSVKGFATVGIPDLPNIHHQHSSSPIYHHPFACVTYAVKSALPVTAREVSSEILEDHTAPLCPIFLLAYN